MSITKISNRLSVMAQPKAVDFQTLADLGFTTVINARPDGEEPSQPGTDAEAAAAGQAKLGYAFIPVTVATLTEADVRAFQRSIEQSDGPVIAHCKSGMRALLLHAIGEVLDGRMEPGEVIAFGLRHGIDLAAAFRWLATHFSRRPVVKGFFAARTSSVQYVVSDPETGQCAIIDPVFDFDERAGATASLNADMLLDYIRDNRLTVAWILDTHPHADHVSAAHYLKQKTGAPTAIGERVVEIQRLWKEIYNWPELATDGLQWDRLFSANETFKIGSLEAKVMLSPGHTLASVTYLIGDAAFIHDTLFMPDSGTARTDFPGGDPHLLWRSIEDILALPDETRLFTGHDYQAGGRTPRWESTVAEQKASNIHIAGVTEEDFVALRTARDKTLPMPKLILHALQVNVQGGRLPEPESDGKRYLKYPLNALGGGSWA